MRTTPYLIQRFKVKNGQPSVMHYDYMGAAEFEYGAIGRATEEMKNECHLAEPLVTEIVSKDGKISWYVGISSRLELAKVFFETELTKKVGAYDRTLKEPTHIAGAYDDSPENAASYQRQYVGWWCLDRGLTFAIFMAKEYSDTFVKAVLSPLVPFVERTGQP